MGDVHVHHIVVGIVMALVSATLIIGFEPVDNLFELFLCAAFGTGAAFILDEFALVFRPDDVYWSEEGRSSIDAVIIAVIVGQASPRRSSLRRSSTATSVGLSTWAQRWPRRRPTRARRPPSAPPTSRRW